jgi:hypothetical protein
MPAEHQASLAKLIGYLHSVSLNVEVNLMGTVNLATVVGPNILYPQQVDATGDYFQQAAMANSIVSFIIQEYSRIFQNINPQQQKPRASNPPPSDYAPPPPSDYAPPPPSDFAPPPTDFLTPPDEYPNSDSS